MATIFDSIVGLAGELRYDSSLDITYRYNSRTATWEIDGSGTPSSAGLPTENIVTGEIREDIDTGKKYKRNGSAWVLIVKAGDSDEDGTPNTVEDGGITTAKIADGAVTSAKIDTGVIQTKTVTITSAEILALNATPKELIAAPGAGKAIIIDKIIGTIDYGSAAYTTNTTLEIRYGTATTKVCADITSLLTATADKSVSVGGLEALLVTALNDNIEVNVATGEALAGDSDIKLTLVYRVISI